MSNKLDEAITLAKKYHEGQKRRDGKPFIVHPMAVMDFLKEHNFPEEALIAAILHDLCEDTDYSNINLSDLFGKRVGFIVNALSKNKKPRNNRALKEEYEKRIKQRKVSNLENYNNLDEYVDYRFHLYLNRLYTGIIAEPLIFFIKVADQIDNLKDMSPFAEEKKMRKINEVENYFVPIYAKSKEVFQLDPKSFKKYTFFMDSLYKTIANAKNNINN